MAVSAPATRLRRSVLVAGLGAVVGDRRAGVRLVEGAIHIPCVGADAEQRHGEYVAGVRLHGIALDRLPGGVRGTAERRAITVYPDQQLGGREPEDRVDALRVELDGAP